MWYGNMGKTYIYNADWKTQNTKKGHTLDFHLYATLEKVHLIYSDIKQISACLIVEVGILGLIDKRLMEASRHNTTLI